MTSVTAAVVSVIAATEVPDQTIVTADSPDSLAAQATYLAAAAVTVVAEVKAAAAAAVAVANFGPAVDGTEAAAGHWPLSGFELETVVVVDAAAAASDSGQLREPGQHWLEPGSRELLG